MYNILITDDEQIVIDSLEFIMNKNFPSQVKVFSALSGTEALNVVNSEKIDIIFMDINMPGMNGLETVSCILRLKPDAVIIMLSAFDRFQYAQEAMNLGAFKYITKPVNRNLVIQTVRAAMNEVDEKRGQLSNDLELHKKLDIVSPMVESDFIYSCIFSNEKNTDVSTYLDYFNIQEKNWCFCCLELPGITTANQYEVYNRIRAILSSHCKCLLGSFMTNRLVIFFPISATEGVSCQDAMREELRKIFALLSIEVSQKLRAGVSTVQSDTGGMARCYNQAVDALNSSPAEGGIVFAGDLLEGSSKQADVSELASRIIVRLKVGDGAGVRFLTSEYFDALFSQEANLNRLKNIVFELLVNVRSETTRLCDAVSKGSFSDDAFDSVFGFLSSHNERSEIEDFVQKRFLECTAAILNLRTQKENPVIKKVVDFIRANLASELSLESVAQEAGVSSFYLSKLFKEETGETFINFVSDCRLDKARQLLAETAASVKEITAIVGYNDQNYFSKLFKNKYGVSPTEFRTAAVQEAGE